VAGASATRGTRDRARLNARPLDHRQPGEPSVDSQNAGQRVVKENGVSANDAEIFKRMREPRVSVERRKAKSAPASE